MARDLRRRRDHIDISMTSVFAVLFGVARQIRHPSEQNREHGALRGAFLGAHRYSRCPHHPDVHARVSPIAPIPRAFAVKVFNPATGKYVYFDDCFRDAGDLVDGDMKPCDLVDAKGPRYEFLYAHDWSTAMDQNIKQAEKELQAADARGVGLKWYFAEKGAADKTRTRFEKEGLKRIIVGYMPPRRRW